MNDVTLASAWSPLTTTSSMLATTGYCWAAATPGRGCRSTAVVVLDVAVGGLAARDAAQRRPGRPSGWRCRSSGSWCAPDPPATPWRCCCGSAAPCRGWRRPRARRSPGQPRAPSPSCRGGVAAASARRLAAESPGAQQFSADRPWPPTRLAAPDVDDLGRRFRGAVDDLRRACVEAGRRGEPAFARCDGWQRCLGLGVRGAQRLGLRIGVLLRRPGCRVRRRWCPGRPRRPVRPGLRAQALLGSTSVLASSRIGCPVEPSRTTMPDDDAGRRCRALPPRCRARTAQWSP